MGRIEAVCIGQEKGEKKATVKTGELIANFGLKGDAHGGPGPLQISMLPLEGVLDFSLLEQEIEPGAFGENLLVSRVDFSSLSVGDRLKIGPKAIAEITQIGKECAHPCGIFYILGRCIMPTEGVFLRVIRGGKIKKGDTVTRLCIL